MLKMDIENVMLSVIQILMVVILLPLAIVVIGALWVGIWRMLQSL